MKNFSTTGFLSNSCKTISFTIPLNKNAIADDIYFQKMDIEVRHIGGGFLLNEDVMQSDLTVVTKLESLGVFVSITKNTPFVSTNEIPLSVYIKEAIGVFA